jgi:hypothetical protein
MYNTEVPGMKTIRGCAEEYESFMLLAIQGTTQISSYRRFVGWNEALNMLIPY